MTGRTDNALVDRKVAEALRLIVDIGRDLTAIKEAFDTFTDAVPDVDQLPPALDSVVAPIKARLDSKFTRLHPELSLFMENGGYAPGVSNKEFLDGLRAVVVKILAQQN